VTHYCDHEDIAHAYYARNIWVALGDGLAICASRVGELKVVEPWPPYLLTHHAFLDQLTWGVSVKDSRTNVIHRIGFFGAEGDARALARKIVGQMQEVAGV